MSLFAMTWAWELEEAPDGTPLTYADKLVLLALADHIHHETNRCYPGLIRLCKRTRLSDKPVRNAIKRLCKMQLIKVDRTKGLQAEYYLALPDTIEKAKVGTKTHAHPSDPARRNSPVRKTGLWKRRESPVSGPQSPVPGPQSPVSATAITVSNGKEPKDSSPSPKNGGRGIVQASLPMADQGPVEKLERTTPAKAKGDPLEGFDAFWANYPRKVAKDDAKAAWPKAVKKVGGHWTDIVDGLRARLHLPVFDARDGKQYIPYPATWLNRGQWNDEIPGAESLEDDGPTEPNLPLLGKG